MPGFKAPANYFGIFIPKGVPPRWSQTLEKIWAEQIAKSEALKKYAAEQRRAVRAVCGRRRAEGGDAGVRPDAWLLSTAARPRSSPDTVGIPKP